MKRIQIQIDNEKLHDKLKKFAKKHGKLMKFVVKEALEKYFAECENNG